MEQLSFSFLFYYFLIFLISALVRMRYITKASLVIHSNNPPSNTYIPLWEGEVSNK